jgi:hypothetical protein
MKTKNLKWSAGKWKRTCVDVENCKHFEKGAENVGDEG